MLTLLNHSPKHSVSGGLGAAPSSALPARRDTGMLECIVCSRRKSRTGEGRQHSAETEKMDSGVNGRQG